MHPTDVVFQEEDAVVEHHLLPEEVAILPLGDL